MIEIVTVPHATQLFQQVQFLQLLKFISCIRSAQIFVLFFITWIYCCCYVGAFYNLCIISGLPYFIRNTYFKMECLQWDVLSLSFGTPLFSVQKFVPDFQIYNLIKFYQYTRLKTFHPFLFPKLFEILIKSTLFKIFSFPRPYWKLTIQGILTRINILYYRNFKILYKSEIQTWEIWIVCPVCICNRFSVLLSAKTFKLVCRNFSIYLLVLLLLSCIKINTKKDSRF